MLSEVCKYSEIKNHEHGMIVTNHQTVMVLLSGHPLKLWGSYGAYPVNDKFFYGFDDMPRDSDGYMIKTKRYSRK